MTHDLPESTLAQMVATVPLDQACLIVISELRDGVLKSQSAIQMLQREQATGQYQLSEEDQSKLMTMAESGTVEAISVINELLAGVLLQRLKALESTRSDANHTSHQQPQ